MSSLLVLCYGCKEGFENGLARVSLGAQAKALGVARESLKGLSRSTGPDWELQGLIRATRIRV